MFCYKVDIVKNRMNPTIRDINHTNTIPSFAHELIGLAYP